MFDVDLANGESYRESRSYRPGEIAVTADLPWGRLGLTICYDLRFPALYRALAEAGSLVSCHPLGVHQADRRSALARAQPRARHRERRYVFAAAQGGRHENGRETFGHSLIVDPWGAVIAEGGLEPGVVLASIDPAQVRAARAKVPSLVHGRRFQVVEPSASTAFARGRGFDMIRYALACERGHSFESWFQNSTAYDKQVKHGLVVCPVCNSTKVEKAIMAPRLAGARKRDKSAPPERVAALETPAPAPAHAPPAPPPSPVRSP